MERTQVTGGCLDYTRDSSIGKELRLEEFKRSIKERKKIKSRDRSLINTIIHYLVHNHNPLIWENLVEFLWINISKVNQRSVVLSVEINFEATKAYSLKPTSANLAASEQPQRSPPLKQNRTVSLEVGNRLRSALSHSFVVKPFRQALQIYRKSQ